MIRLEKEASLWDKERAALNVPRCGTRRTLKWKEEEKPSPKWAERYGKDFMLAMEFLDRSEAKQKEKIAERPEKEQRLKRTVRWAFVASVLVAILAVVGWWQFADAKRATWKAEEATQRAEEARKDADDVITHTCGRIVRSLRYSWRYRLSRIFGLVAGPSLWKIRISAMLSHCT